MVTLAELRWSDDVSGVADGADQNFIAGHSLAVLTIFLVPTRFPHSAVVLARDAGHDVSTDVPAE